MTRSDKITIVALLLFTICGTFIFHHHCTQYTEYTYSLEEITDGTYAIYYSTVSNIPDKNYDVVKICSENRIHTFSGDVYITFIDGEPYARVKEYNMVNADDIYLYVPKDTIVYQEPVAIQRK